VVASFNFGTGLDIVQLCISVGWLSVKGIPVLDFVFSNSLYSGVFAMVGGLVLVPIVSLLTQKTLPADVDGKFRCFNKA
jgi:SSS family solute:Na+ symporter